ncbi:hypothetical protein R1sor_026678 [Riccia sorocarpa]|uniref:Uncharacterized protein n=1 Tax=Riccia sorocarpa TaxID=122646 RepID=A0ABD3GF80_9MARC
MGTRFSVNAETSLSLQNHDWFWKPRAKEYRGWSQPTKIWAAIAGTSKISSERLNRKWTRQESSRKWEKRVRKIWDSPLPLKEKIWWWNLLQDGMPTNSATYNEKSNRTPVRVSVLQATQTLSATAESVRDGNKSKEKLTEAISELNRTFNLDDHSATQHSEMLNLHSHHHEAGRNEDITVTSCEEAMAARTTNFPMS